MFDKYNRTLYYILGLPFIGTDIKSSQVQLGGFSILFLPPESLQAPSAIS